MSEEEKKWNKRDKPTYIMVPRRLITTWIITTLFTWVLIAGTVQYAIYINNRSDSRMCGIVELFDSANKTNPPSNDFGRKVAYEFTRLRTGYHCK